MKIYQGKIADIESVMTDMKRQYSGLSLWLKGYDLTGQDIKDADISLYDSILDTIESMDKAMIAEDIQGFKTHLNEVKRLYLEAVRNNQKEIFQS